MTGIDLDLAGIRARAEAATPGPWSSHAVPPMEMHEGVLHILDGPPTHHALKRVFETEEFGRCHWFLADVHPRCGPEDLSANIHHIAGLHPPTVIAMCDRIERQAGEIARLKAEVAECKRAAVKAVVPLEAMRMAGTDKDFCPQLRDGVNDGIASVRALVTPKEDTPCRTA